MLLRAQPRDYRTYVEPFAGSACLFFAIGPTPAMLGDFNDDLMNAYRVLVRHPRQLARAVADLPTTRDAYYAVRAQGTEELDDFKRGVRFMYLNRYSFNGVYRTNRAGLFNVPMGQRTGRPLTEAELYRCAYALRGAQLLAEDFEATIALAGENDFVYADPPYATGDRPAFGEYGYGTFSQSDLPRLLVALNSAVKRGAHVLLSYSSGPAVLAELGDWQVAPLSVRRRVAGGNAHRCIATEILASKSNDDSWSCVAAGARVSDPARRQG